MAISNKVLVTIFLEEGHKQDDDEYDARWRPINFDIYNPLFLDLVDEAISNWLGDHQLKHNHAYEILFKHIVEHDGGGAVTSEYFEPIHHETQQV